MSCSIGARAALLLGLAALAATARSQAPAPADTPYPGTIVLKVDATDLDRRVMRVRETLPVAAPGPLTLYYPRWLPGNHGPTGRITELAGLTISAAGRPLAWKRDPLDVHAFALDVPAGVTALEIEFEQLTPVGSGGGGRVVVTPEMLNVQWNAVLLYPAGHHDSRITVRPSLKLPDGWAWGSALRAGAGATVGTAAPGGTIDFNAVSVETLIDSPVFAGRHLARVDLDPDAAAAGRAPVFLDVVADTPGELAITPEQLAAHRALVTQADRLFGARHYAHYDFLLAISDQLGGIGLEHHQSSENGVAPGYFVDWAKSAIGRTLLPHEYAHSWNGKYRRPADLWTPNTNTPMQDSLLWVYEGQTQFWGDVLAARSGLVAPAEMRDRIANLAAWADRPNGRSWRNLQDTTNQAVMGGRRDQGAWRDRQRGADYYDEMVLVWLEADMLIRDGSGGQRSLDDFARAFFGPQAGRPDADITPLTYRFEDVVAALMRVQPHDWTAFLRERLDSHQPGGPLKGLERAGWRLAWDEAPNSATKGQAARWKVDDFTYSLGVQVGKDGRLTSVGWGSPAFDAGLTTAAQLVAVDAMAYKSERLTAAIKAAKAPNAAPIQLLVKDGERYRTVAIPWRGGLRFPKLERIDGTPDRLTPVLTALP